MGVRSSLFRKAQHVTECCADHGKYSGINAVSG